MVLHPEFFGQVGEAVRMVGEPDRGRLDVVEQTFGRIAMRGKIFGVVDSDTGAIIVETDGRIHISARIREYRYPIPRRGDEVIVLYAIDGNSIALPIGPELPQQFTGQVRIVQGDDPNLPHNAVVEHDHHNVGNGRVFARALRGLTLTVDQNNPSLSTWVLCGIHYVGKVTDTQMVEHEIYIIGEIPNPGAI